MREVNLKCKKITDVTSTHITQLVITIPIEVDEPESNWWEEDYVVCPNCGRSLVISVDGPILLWLKRIAGFSVCAVIGALFLANGRIWSYVVGGFFAMAAIGLLTPIAIRGVSLVDNSSSESHEIG